MNTTGRTVCVSSIAVVSSLTVATLSGQASLAPNQDRSSRPQGCEWCGADEAPADLTWRVTIADEKEPGERLMIRGTVYQADGATPAPNLILYMYHTNAAGEYPGRGDETGNGRCHGYLRGWLRTNQLGQYEVSTIRPAPYPGRNSPAHIHVTVKQPNKPEYWIDSFNFEGDPLITPRYRERLQNRGGSGIIRLRRDADGVWRGERDIILMP